MKKFFIPFLFSPALALGANTAVLSWDSPLTWEGATVTFNIYQGLQGQPKTKLGTVGALTTTISSGLASGSNYCWQVSAVANNQESALSNEACKPFPFTTPAAPAALTVK